MTLLPSHTPSPQLPLPGRQSSCPTSSVFKISLKILSSHKTATNIFIALTTLTLMWLLRQPKWRWDLCSRKGRSFTKVQESLWSIHGLLPCCQRQQWERQKGLVTPVPRWAVAEDVKTVEEEEEEGGREGGKMGSWQWANGVEVYHHLKSPLPQLAFW